MKINKSPSLKSLYKLKFFLRSFDETPSWNKFKTLLMLQWLIMRKLLSNSQNLKDILDMAR